MHEMRHTTMKHMNERYEPHSTTIHSLQAHSGTEIRTTVYLVVSCTPKSNIKYIERAAGNLGWDIIIEIVQFRVI